MKRIFNKEPAEKLVGEILRAAAVELAGKALLWIGGAALLAFGFLIWQGGAIPAWIVFLIVLVFLMLLRRQAHILHGAAEELGRHGEYSRHLQLSLDALQRVISGDVDAEIPYFLEQAVLEPARRILSEKPAEEVRLSVLLPAENDSSRWSMPWAAGHSMTGKLKYEVPISETLARHAFESGDPQYWGNTEAQTEFRQNPAASAPTRSMVSLPIQEGDEILGVFNAVSSEQDAFDEAEQTFLASLAGVIAVAVSVWHQRSESSAESDRDGL
jgi:GAF domain-containing protein